MTKYLVLMGDTVDHMTSSLDKAREEAQTLKYSESHALVRIVEVLERVDDVTMVICPECVTAAPKGLRETEDGPMCDACYGDPEETR